MYDIVISALSSHAQSKSSTGYDDDSAKVLCSVTQFKKNVLQIIYHNVLYNFIIFLYSVYKEKIEMLNKKSAI